ncbi:uncharacterized protein LOC142554569 [Primulina tabacum]|uniref:uncharacterized protein LOC142554569 n=1 Tax=Primulina tabacum TaxID=48773 RepID=UPI003F5A9E2D
MANNNMIVDNDSDELWMVVHKNSVRFSLLEYCLITGLDCAIVPVDLPDGGVFGSRHFVVLALKKDLLGRYTCLTEAHGRKEVDGSFFLGGFVLPIQILAYEYYPSVTQKFAKKRDVVDGLMLPKMFHWVTNTWPSNRAPSAVDVSAAFGDCAIADCLGCLTPTPEELVSLYYTTGVFVDSAPDAVITRVLELWRQGQTVICS